MPITSVARLMLDTRHSTTDWNEQKRWMHNNSWLTTLPFDVDNTDLPTPFWKTPCILHISSMDHASLDPAHTMPCHPADTSHYNTQLSSPRPVCHCLTFLPDSSESDQAPDSSSDNDQDPDSSSDEEEDFQRVPMDDKHWTTEMVPERTFCIHENGLPNNVCQYPCPYGNNNDSVSYMDSLDLSNISDYEDYMMTTSDNEELPGLEEVPYWTLVCLNTYLTLWFRHWNYMGA